MEAEIRQAIPNIDPVLSDYASGYLQHAATLSSQENATEFLTEAASLITSLLLSAAGSIPPKQQTSIRELVEKQVSKLEAQNGANGDKAGRPLAIRRLEKAVHVGSQKNVSAAVGLAGLAAGSVDLDAVNTRKVESRVDKKKLEKAERKIRAKQERKTMKMVEYEASKLIEADNQENYEDFFMSVNPLQLDSAQGQTKSKDIKVEGVDVQVGGKRILSDTTLTLSYGRRYGLVGQNGVGKSTLLRALSRRELAVPTYISILHVEQEITGDDTPALQAVLDADVWRKHLMAEQERITTEMAAIEEQRPKVENETPEAAELDNKREDLDSLLVSVHSKLAEMEADKAESRAASILAGLGFTTERQQHATRTFSGGWRMRLALARALFCRPDLLLLDEPSNMLDVPSITFLSHYLQGYPATVLVVSHDRAFLNEVATDIIHQHSERLDYYRGGNFDAFYATKEERRKTAAREYENQMAQRAHLQAFIDKFRYNAAKAAEAQSRIKKLEKMPVLEAPEAEYSVQFRFPEVEKLSPPIIQMTEVAFGYSPDKPLLKNIDLSVILTSRIGIVGPNGAGKTTMLKLLLNKLSPSTGLISANPRLRIGYFTQHHVDSLDLNLNAVQFLATLKPNLGDEAYRSKLAAFGITGLTALQKIGLLSGGQKSRVAFAALGLNNPHILVMDEPSNHLDVEAMDALAAALTEFEGGVVIVSHDVTLIKKVCTELWICEGGLVKLWKGAVTGRVEDEEGGGIEAYKRFIVERADERGLIQH